MAHCTLLFVGPINNLQKIFDNAPDSSSESAAELTIGADWVDWEDEYRGSGEFTKNIVNTSGKSHLNYDDVISGNWYECYDIRNTNRYGSFDCLNCPDFEPYDGKYDEERAKRNKERAIRVIKTLPDDTVFFFADSHW